MKTYRDIFGAWLSRKFSHKQTRHRPGCPSFSRLAYRSDSLRRTLNLQTVESNYRANIQFLIESKEQSPFLRTGCTKEKSTEHMRAFAQPSEVA